MNCYAKNRLFGFTEGITNLSGSLEIFSEKNIVLRVNILTQQIVLAKGMFLGTRSNPIGEA